MSGRLLIFFNCISEDIAYRETMIGCDSGISEGETSGDCIESECSSFILNDSEVCVG
jgi:hypothetical protein